MLYNHTNAQIKRIQKTIKKLNQRHTSLTKRGYKNLPQTKEYEELFKKIGDGRMNIMLDKNAFMPERAHDLDAGYDLRTPIDFKIHCRDFETIDTGVHVEIPKGYVGFLKSKSGLNIKDGITGEGVIDAGYTGSIKVKLYNNSFYLKKFKKGDKIIQLVILPIFTPELQKVDKFAETERGDNGFGSTGR